MATLQTFGGGTTDFILDPGNGAKPLGNAPYTVIDGVTMLPASGLTDANGMAVTQLVSDADGRYAGSALLEGSTYWLDCVGSRGPFRAGPQVSTTALANVVSMGPQLNTIAASAAASAFSAKQAQAAAEGVLAGATAPTNTAIDSHLGGDATGLVAAVAGKVSKAGNSVAVGDGAAANITAMNHTVAIGRNAIGKGTLSRDNIGIGDSALKNVSAGDANYNQADLSGTRNVALSGNALYFLASGYLNVAIGRNAGQCLQSGTGLVALGPNAVSGAATIGLTGEIENWSPWGTAGSTIRTVAVGSYALSGGSAYNTVAVGGDALRNSKRSDNNVAVGSKALAQLDAGTGFNGGLFVALSVNGTYSQAGTVVTVTAVGHGLAVGDIAYFRLLDGAAQTFASDVVRAYVASVPTVDTFTVAHPTSQSASGTSSLLGKETNAQQAKNEDNTAVGANALGSLLTGTNNVANGSAALGLATSANWTVAIGKSALGVATGSSTSVAIGFQAGGNINGAANSVTAVGSSALRTKVDGTNMTEAAFSNITGIGYDTRVSGANQVQLGNTAATVYAQAAVQTRSDARDKADVQDTALGLDFIEKLRPVDYRWDRREDYTPLDPETGEVVHLERDGSQKRARFHHGLIAQEVADVIAETGVDFGGFQDHKVAGGSDVLSIGYEELIAPLIKAVQELSAEVKALKAERA